MKKKNYFLPDVKTEREEFDFSFIKKSRLFLESMPVVRGGITERVVCGILSLELEICPLLCSNRAFLSEIVISAGSFSDTRGESNCAANSCTERILFSGFFFSNSTALDIGGEVVDS
jgi:hypothetical protein